MYGASNQLLVRHLARWETFVHSCEQDIADVQDIAGFLFISSVNAERRPAWRMDAEQDYGFLANQAIRE